MCGTNLCSTCIGWTILIFKKSFLPPVFNGGPIVLLHPDLLNTLQRIFQVSYQRLTSTLPQLLHQNHHTIHSHSVVSVPVSLPPSTVIIVSNRHHTITTNRNVLVPRVLQMITKMEAIPDVSILSGSMTIFGWLKIKHRKFS